MHERRICSSPLWAAGDAFTAQKRWDFLALMHLLSRRKHFCLYFLRWNCFSFLQFLKLHNFRVPISAGRGAVATLSTQSALWGRQADVSHAGGGRLLCNHANEQQPPPGAELLHGVCSPLLTTIFLKIFRSAHVSQVSP